MKTSLLILSALLGSALINEAVTVNLYVDSAPNVYGSPNYPSWWSSAQDGATDGTFVNMANSVNPANAGTTNFEIEDVVVYSFDDLGRRLHFVYWVPGETIASLTDKNFQLKLDYDWDGVNYTGFDWYSPTSWTEYEGGVIGTAGWAWWGAYGETDPVLRQQQLEQELAEWQLYQGNINLHARMDGEETTSITAFHSIPEAGSTLLLAGLSSFALAYFSRRK